MKLGKAFPDSLIEGRRQQVRNNPEGSQSWWLGVGRVLIFITLLSVSFFILLWRLFDLAIIQGHHYRTLADGNRTRELVRHAPRGILRDRAGKPLVENIPYYRLIRPCEQESIQDCVAPLTREAGDALLDQGLPAGEFLEIDYRRHYVYPEAVSHLLGYIGELSERELQDEYYSLRDYKRGDKIGRTGAEAVFEDKLRGRDGKELVEVDARGKIVRTLGRVHEIPGIDITLSIDVALQEAALSHFPKGEKGAVIVSKPSTGEILALFSSPTYDVNHFTVGLTQQEYDALMDNPDQPLFDRAIGGVYPPGSTFKIVTALAALEEGAITATTTVEDIGVLTIGPFSFPNWFFLQYGKTDGVVDVVKALKRSNDIFFYKTGEWLGITKLAAWAHTVGIGKPSGIELGGEAIGLMPDPAWKKTRFSTPGDREARNDEWYLGDTYHVSIGQGYVLTTPLQVNLWTNVIANNGSLCRPTIEKANVKRAATARCSRLSLKDTTVQLITKGMQQACEPGGTGWPLFNFSVSDKESSPSSKLVPLACKTGTAEFGDPKNKTHAWFTAFAPLPADSSAVASAKVEVLGSKSISGDPELTVTVLVEAAGEGSYIAAPVAKKILEEWFSR